MKLLTALRRLLSGLAVLGLVLAPLAPPAMAMGVNAGAVMSDHEAMAQDAAMAMPGGMPCCPEKAPVPDCGKDCPLMALCMANFVPTLPTAANGQFVVFKLASVVMPRNDPAVGSLSQAPPHRPPKT
jgi:hypothetical protein